jgi:hypothetical protein
MLNSLAHEHKECSAQTIEGELIGKKFIKRRDKVSMAEREGS